MHKNNCYLFNYLFQEFVRKKQFLEHLVYTWISDHTILLLMSSVLSFCSIIISFNNKNRRGNGFY